MTTDDMFDDAREPATKGDLCSVRDGLAARLDGHDRRFDSIEGNLRRLNLGFARMEGDMTEMKGKVDVLLTLKDEFSRFKSDIERMTHFLEISVRRTDSQGSMLMEHEYRLKKLESRPQ